MPAHVIEPNASLSAVLDESTFTLARLKANPLTSAFAPDFEAIQAEWILINAKEIQLRTALVSASALVAAADDDLNILVDALDKAVLIETQNNRKAPEYLLYFGKKRPSELKKTILGEQLDTMRSWVGSLAVSPSQALKDLGVSIADKVAAADTAVVAQATAEQANRDFRLVGERKAFIDKVNALRKSTHGKLSELPHAHPEARLPVTFAELFFRHEVARKPEVAPTVAELGAQIEAKEAEVIALKEHLASVLAEEAKLQAAKDRVDADKAALAAAEKEAEAAVAKVAALKAKLPPGA